MFVLHAAKSKHYLVQPFGAMGALHTATSWSRTRSSSGRNLDRQPWPVPLFTGVRARDVSEPNEGAKAFGVGLVGRSVMDNMEGGWRQGGGLSASEDLEER